VHLREILTAFTIDVVMMAGIALPLLIIVPRLKQSPLSWIGTYLMGGFSWTIMVALAIRYLGTQGSSGFGGLYTSSFWWGMGGFGFVGGFMALLMGTFGTDAARTESELPGCFHRDSVPDPGSRDALRLPTDLAACLLDALVDRARGAGPSDLGNFAAGRSGKLDRGTLGGSHEREAFLIPRPPSSRKRGANK